MRNILAMLLLTTLPAGAANAQNMPASTFLQKAEALKKKGAMALLSSDMGLLKKEMTGAANALRAERLAAQKAGRKPAFCPPAKAAGMGADEIIGHFQSIPAPERARMTSRDGFRTLLAKKYPCR